MKEMESAVSKMEAGSKTDLRVIGSDRRAQKERRGEAVALSIPAFASGSASLPAGRVGFQLRSATGRRRGGRRQESAISHQQSATRAAGSEPRPERGPVSPASAKGERSAWENAQRLEESVLGLAGSLARAVGKGAGYTAFLQGIRNLLASAQAGVFLPKGDQTGYYPVRVLDIPRDYVCCLLARIDLVRPPGKLHKGTFKDSPFLTHVWGEPFTGFPVSDGFLVVAGNHILLPIPRWLQLLLHLGDLCVRLDRMEKAGLRDLLTGASSRGVFLSHLDYAIRRANRRRTPFGVILIDIDRLSSRNGDAEEILLRTAQAIRRGVKETDLVSRMGGDEFGVIVENADLVGVGQVAERLRVNLPGDVRVRLYEDCPLTFSLGISQYKPRMRRHHIIMTADEALRRAKRQGGNCVGRYP